LPGEPFCRIIYTVMRQHTTILLICAAALLCALAYAVTHRRPGRDIRAPHLSGYLLPLLFLAISGMIFSDVAAYRRSLAWPEMRGVVTGSRQVCTRSRHGENCSVEVRYTYGIRSACVEIEDGSVFPTLSGRAAEIVRQYPAGQAVTVRYDPSDPERSRLAGNKPKDWKMGLFFLLAAAVAWRIRGGRD